MGDGKRTQVRYPRLHKSGVDEVTPIIDKIGVKMKNWYERRHELKPEMVFRHVDDTIVKLDMRVPGDGTKWFVANWHNGSWGYWYDEVEPSDLKEHIVNPVLEAFK